ncbi:MULTISPECIES: dTDP-glucose 4,6-dehydratase [unclassified Synechococcus]|uniref:dTDP-glucose 4,6-dehydratase n=1 Tax=unclassified Synechococcus TaxID=2626047 RepID=UPI0039AEE26F
MTSSMPSAAELLGSRKRVLVTGGGGFIGGAVVRRLLRESRATVFNLDKMGYASDLTSIKEIMTKVDDNVHQRHVLQRVDLAKADSVNAAVKQADPDLVMHLAAESHVDRSISGPGVFIESNVTGTYNLLQAVRRHYESLSGERRETFRMLHISTDEVFGSLSAEGSFSETTPYDPSSPYSASKAASDHLVKAWHRTFGLPIVLTNCSNNYGPWQFPEKLIPIVILKAAGGELIPLYGDGLNVRDWLYVEDHVDALILAACEGEPGRSYCVGGNGERTNKEVVHAICQQLDQCSPESAPHSDLITPVADRPGHDRRYAIDPTRISAELGWRAQHNLEQGLTETVHWYLTHQEWCRKMRERASYFNNKLGTNQSPELAKSKQ